MSRQAPLPPRCPFNKKTLALPSHDLVSPTPCIDNELYPRHKKSISQSSILEYQPAWLDDLLCDSDSNSRGSILHRRSASDSLTMLDGIVPSPCLKMLNECPISETTDTGSGLESNCIYGPNSPRSKAKLNFPENAIVSALAEYVSQNPLRYLEVDPCMSGNVQLESVRDACSSPGQGNAETKPVKQHSRQRSRVRKLQYIAELERTVDSFQTLESELAVRVSSLLQQRVALSMENSKLKQQVARLQQQKLIVDGQYQYLRKEVERLKNYLECSPSNKVSTYFRSGSAIQAASLEATWKMLDWGKLNIN